MCRANGDDTVELLQERDRRARIEHTCGECRRTIGVGEVYHYETWVWEGRMGDASTCLHCCQARRWLHVVCSGWIYEDVQDDILDHVTGDERELRTLPLTRLARWMVNDWRDRNGNLRSIASVTSIVDDAIAAYKKLLVKGLT